MAYWGAMRWICGCALASLLLAGCSSPNETKTPAAAVKNETAPDIFKVNLDTSKGPVVIEMHRDWAPIGVDHFYSLVKTGFFDNARFFRVVRNFVVQFGINGDPATNRLWANANLPDDPVKESNVKGTLTYATRGPNTRSTQLFINLKDNGMLDSQGFAPIGKVVTGMDVVENFYNSYGDMPPSGNGPDPTLIQQQGNDYLASRFPRLDYIKKATVAAP
jgi:peptidyl-prolyl cis-trans isomerase A (cyclophilin A)